jgi:hypothetical protein
MRASEMIRAVKEEGGFDSQSSNSSESVILSWLNQRYREMVAESKWVKSVRDLGPTVAGQGQYAVPEDVTDVRTIRVNGSRQWLLVSTEDLWALQSGDAWTYGAAGVFAANFESDTDPVIELFPAPSTSGYEITALCAVLPSDLTTSPDATPKVPIDMHQAIVDGAIGLGLLRVFERSDLAQPYEARFREAVDKLHRRANSRIGSGPRQFKVAGVHF